MVCVCALLREPHFCLVGLKATHKEKNTIFKTRKCGLLMVVAFLLLKKKKRGRTTNNKKHVAAVMRRFSKSPSQASWIRASEGGRRKGLSGLEADTRRVVSTNQRVWGGVGWGGVR